jgi:hypothetical protein
MVRRWFHEGAKLRNAGVKEPRWAARKGEGVDAVAQSKAGAGCWNDGVGAEGQEPAHIHVRTPDGECKFWLEPTVRLARNRGVRAQDLRRIEQLVFENHDVLRRAFNEYHNR